MTIAGKILQHIKGLPEQLQTEVLNFVVHLESKKNKETEEWSDFSLSHAMRGMEDESSPYSIKDLKERFS